MIVVMVDLKSSKNLTKNCHELAPLFVSVISKSFALRCLSFPDMEHGDLVGFQPDKEICGGRDITEEQRYPPHL